MDSLLVNHMSDRWWIVECCCGREYQHGKHEMPEARCWIEECENLLCEDCYEEEWAMCGKCSESYCYDCGCRCNAEWAEEVERDNRRLGID